MKQIFKKIAFVVFAGCWIAASHAETPNIVFILMDDLGANSVGCYGSTFHQTPNIDRLAEQGMRFTQASSAGPNCSPTRASILFGQYPARLHLTDWIPGRQSPHAKLACPQHRYAIPVDTPSIPSLMKPLGYTTAWIGKWHISQIGDTEHEPADYGFDTVFEDWGLNRSSTPEDPKGVFTLTDKALDFMESNHKKPFFLMLSHYSVHDPVQCHPDTAKEYEVRAQAEGQDNPRFAAMLDAADESIGRLLGGMEALGLTENTVILFASDNGGLLHHASNGPLRGQKAMLYEGGVRVPFIVRWPGRVRAGSVSDTPVSSIDLLPTFMALGGAQEFPEELDGVSFADVFTAGAALDRDALFWHYPHYNKTTPVSAVRMGRYKLLHFYEDDRMELYDLSRDASESKNLTESMPERTAAMNAKLEAWKRSVNAQEVRPNPDYDPDRAEESIRMSDGPPHVEESAPILLTGVWEQQNKPSRCFVFNDDGSGIGAGGSSFQWLETNGEYKLVWDESGKNGPIQIQENSRIKIGKSTYRKRSGLNEK